MKIAVVGATGGTGRLVIEKALQRGHEVVAYVRDSHKLKSGPGLQIVQGELFDVVTFSQAIRGADALLCCLGTHETKNVDLMQTSLPFVIQAMQNAGIGRLVLLSAYGVGDTARTASWFARFAYKTIVASVYRDKERSEALLSASDLKWTGIYPVILTDGPMTGGAEVRPLTQVRKVSGLPKVSRANVASAMLDALEDSRTIGQRLLVSSKGSVR